MKVLLKMDVKGSGKAGEIINAKEGYARNYLIPRGLAVEATGAVLREVEAKSASLEHQAQMEKQAALDAAEKLKAAHIVVSAKGGTNKLFGSVTPAEVAEAITTQYGVTVDKKRITLPEIKTYGDFECHIKLHTEVAATVAVTVQKAE